MGEVLCGICNAQPKKYKCPTCSLPYCSLACFKLHKPNHEGQDAVLSSPASTTTPKIPQPPPPAPVPKYLRQKIDFSVLTSNLRFQELLGTHDTLLPSLQRVYAATIEPDPDGQRRPYYDHFQRGGYHGRGRGRGRGWGDRGRGRGGYGGHGERPKWTQKKGDADAMRLLKGLRDGKRSDDEEEAMAAFVRLVQETFGEEKDESKTQETEMEMG